MEFVIECPHCHGLIMIKHRDVNCKIFRHAIWKNEQKERKTRFNPHAKKVVCEEAFRKGLIYGCGKPFRLIKTKHHQEFIVKKCDYI